MNRAPALRPVSPRSVSRSTLAVLFIAAGVMHFVKPRSYERIVPPGLPSPATLVAVSGLAEIVGGVGLVIPRLRRPAGWGLVALLVAVFPANVYMAVRPDRFTDLGVPAWLLWLRLPLQGGLIAWAERSSRGDAGVALGVTGG